MADKQVRHTRSGEKRYRIRWRDATGRQQTKTFTRSKDADAWKLKVELEAQQGTLSGETPQTFGEFLGPWLDRYEQSVRPSTFDRRKQLLPHLKEFEPLTFERLTPAFVEDVVAGIAKQHPRTGQLVLETVKMVVQSAQKRGQRINPNVLTVAKPKTTKRTHRYLTPEEVQALADASTEPNLITFAAYTGLRQGECFALLDERVSDTHVHVAHSIYKGNYGDVKTRAGRRSVPLTRAARQAVLLQKLSRRKGTDILFPTPTGRIWQRHNFNRSFRQWVENAGLSGVVFHDLRHTYASLMIRAGVHPKVLQELMGHDTFNVTMDLYGHLYEGQTTEAAKQLDDMLERREGERQHHGAEQRAQ